jgi:hypothetical protein
VFPIFGKSSSGHTEPIKGDRVEERKRAEVWLDAVYADIKSLSDIWLKVSISGRLSSREARRATKMIIAERDWARFLMGVTPSVPQMPP